MAGIEVVVVVAETTVVSESQRWAFVALFAKLKYYSAVEFVIVVAIAVVGRVVIWDGWAKGITTAEVEEVEKTNGTYESAPGTSEVSSAAAFSSNFSNKQI